MIRDASGTSPWLDDGSDGFRENFPKEHSEKIEEWIDKIDRLGQVRMLHEMRDRIPTSEFNSKFSNKDSNNHYTLAKELRKEALGVKISNSELQPEPSHIEPTDSESNNKKEDWYHLTPLGFEFLRSITEKNGPPLLKPISIADDLKGFIKGVPDESRRFDEYIVRTDQYENEKEFENIRNQVADNEYTEATAPPVIPKDPYMISNELDILTYEGSNTHEGQQNLEYKISQLIQDCVQVRLFGPWNPVRSADCIKGTPSFPNISHRFIAGKGFIEKIKSDRPTDTMERFVEGVCDHPHIKMESTNKYLPYVLGILENKERTDCQIFVWGRGNPEEDSFMMFAISKNPSSELYSWADELYEFIAESAQEHTPQLQ